MGSRIAVRRDGQAVVVSGTAVEPAYTYAGEGPTFVAPEAVVDVVSEPHHDAVARRAVELGERHDVEAGGVREPLEQ